MISQIKWVNDIFVGGKKICGILTEASLSAEMQSLDYVIVGIGINTGEIPEEIEDIATSVLEVTGEKGFRNKLVAEILNQLEEVYFAYLLSGKESEILSAYSEKLIYINEKVLVKMYDETFAATVLGIDDTGSLIVKNDEGQVLHINTGEIYRKSQIDL